MPQQTRNSTGFYGWFVVAACFLMTLALGEAFWSFGVFFKPLQDEFGWSRTVVSSAYTAFLIGFAISIMAGGRLVDRLSPRPIVMGTALITGLGIALCSQVHSVNQLRASLFVAGLGSGPLWPVASTTVMRWFQGRRRGGLALAITAVGSGFGAIVFAPLVNYIIQNHGWRNAFLCMGIVVTAIIAMSALIVRRSPLPEARTDSGIDRCPGNAKGPRRTTRVTIASRAFIGITLGIAAAVVAFQAVSVHLIPYATDVGISATSAAVALGLVGGFSILGRLMSGLISDTFGWQRTLGLALFGMGLSLIWLLFMDSAWNLYCFVVSYGIFYGLRIPAGVGIVNQFFGGASLGFLVGISTAVGQVAGAGAPYAAGFVYDRTGSYTLMLFIIMALLMVGGVVCIAMKGPLGTADKQLDKAQSIR